MNRYVEFHLGRTITLTTLSDLLTQISVERFQGFVRVNEVGEGRFVLSFARAATADVSLLTLIREHPGQLYAERSVALLGDWVLEVYTGEIAARTGALIATEDHGSLHPASPMPLTTFADWLLDDPQRHASAAEAFERYGSVVPLPLRGVVNFKERFAR